MSKSVIRFQNADEVREFVNAATKCDFAIDISSNRAIVDAKSILGVFSMDLSRDLTVQCHGENPSFTRTLQKFAVA